MSVLSSFYTPILPEDLYKLGFIPQICLEGLKDRYDLSVMSDTDKANMINENLFYRYTINGHYTIVVNYYPPRFSYIFFKSDSITDPVNVTIDLRRSPINNVTGCQEYNLTIDSKGVPYNPACGQKVYVDNLRELEDWLGMAKIFSEKEPKHIDWEE